MSQKNINNRSIGCATFQCTNKVQAVCFTCQKIFCFKCSLSHAQKYNIDPHNIYQIQDSIPQLSKLSKKFYKHYQQLMVQSQTHSSRIKSQSHSKLSPEKFQQQLDQINFMKKQTLKVVEKFFSEISLQLVNIWEYYLKRFSILDDAFEKLGQLQKKIEVYIEPWNINETKQHILRTFFKQGFGKELDFYFRQLESSHNMNKNGQHENGVIPKCPQICIDDRVLVQLSEVLCGSISTKNYTFQLLDTRKLSSKQKKEQKLTITMENFLHKSVTWVPIFPIKKNHCFLYNLNNKNYEIQEFEKLQYIPDYPKTIIIPNGDIHLIGGTKNDIVLDSHLVFRCSSSEVFKLGNLPLCRNPSNSLIYFNKSIFIIGGINQQHQWDERCFRYYLQTKDWKEISPMSSIKPHQSSCLFNTSIYCFGIPQNKKINIEKYLISQNRWEQISIVNFLSNPFNFSAGFVSCQINQREIILFGGKKFLESATSNKRCTDRTLQENVYVFQPDTNSFLLKGPLYPCLGVQYGQFSPIINENKIYSCQYILCKTNPISRWYDNLQVLEINEKGDIQSIIVLQEE